MRYAYDIVDVFTDVRFGGNPLAVVHDAAGLDDAQMLAITREFNFSETTFVLAPAAQSHDAHVRIFTPRGEVPFAGHPNVGTAYVLAARRGADGPAEERLVFEERAGLVPVTVHRSAGRIVRCELTAPEALSLGEPIEALDALAAALGLRVDQIVTTRHGPRTASVGLPFLCLELRDLASLRSARLAADAWLAFAEPLGLRAAHLYTRATEDPAVDVRARMFTMHLGAKEDPATGSANCALAGLLSALDPRRDGRLEYRIVQGVEMGRPSRLEASVDKRGGAVTAVRIGGACVPVATGELRLD